MVEVRGRYGCCALVQWGDPLFGGDFVGAMVMYVWVMVTVRGGSSW